MKRLITLIMLTLLTFTAINAQINGTLTTVGDKALLRTWGTHAQRGYAHGYLLSQPIKTILRTYVWQSYAMNDITVYNQLSDFCQTTFSIEPRYQTELQAMVNGMTASPSGAYIPELSRDITASDLLLANCLVDLYYYRSELTGDQSIDMGCATLLSWGSATQVDSVLAGHSVISRFLDWNQEETLISHPLLIASFPGETNEQPWLSFTYPGMIGALSAISASGKTAFLNTGNVHDYDTLTNLHPILLSLRNGMELSDYNQDGADNVQDIYNAISACTPLSGSIITAVSEVNGIQSGIIETNNSLGTVMRNVGQGSGLPGMHLAATNHFRLLNSPVCDSRYTNMEDSLSVSQFVSAKRQMRILTGAAAQDNNLMAIQYTPLTGEIRWATATSDQPAWHNEVTILNRNELLDLSNPNHDDTLAPLPQLSCYPNPVRSQGAVHIISGKAQPLHISVYNLKGQKVAHLSSQDNTTLWQPQDRTGKALPAGIYLMRSAEERTANKPVKMVILP